MDKEQQIRLNFLDEAEGYLDQIESVLLALNSDDGDSVALDLVLRAAHSLKGGAGMMGFSAMNKVAHRLEDFFKIIRLRLGVKPIFLEVENLLLKVVDFLRHLITRYHQETEVDDYWVQNQIEPVFNDLHQHLGELNDEDENHLFALNQGAGSELLLFEKEVERILDQFEQQINHLSPEDLAQSLILTAEELMVFSQIANLEAFTQLCQSIQQQTMAIKLKELPEIGQEALRIWRRSHALVVRGSLEKLPDQLIIENNNINDLIIPNLEQLDSLNLDLLQLETELASLDENSLAQIIDREQEKSYPVEKVISTQQTLHKPENTSQMVRVSAEQLSKFNNLFGKLILQRNAVNSQLEELKNFAALMRQRMIKLEQSHNQLRKWYDRYSIEDLLTTASQATTLKGRAYSASSFTTNPVIKDSQKTEFDILEMDRYSDLHLISQEQIETIVQLKEVSTDLELGLLDITQTMGEINQTTKAIQTNINRTQMTPFADVVQRFPRVIRDLSLQFNKQVKIKIEGQSTLIDRAVIETINSPLNHLLRNAFDHGIESPSTRIANGKSPEGLITIKATNRANHTIITVEDDGAGISLEKIGDCLLAKGLSRQEINQLSEQQILNYIFEPGFSTKDQVTELSGRGVGMDVVRTNLREIQGDIQVKTKQGIGTTFIIKIPFSLSILRVRILERGRLLFAISINTIREIKSLVTTEIMTIHNQEHIVWNGQTIPVVKPEQTFNFNRTYKAFPLKGKPIINQPTILIVGEGENLGAIYLDRVWGEQEITIYPINSPIPLPQGFNSSIILGDGRIIPLVEPEEILQKCLESYQQSANIEIPIFQDTAESIDKQSSNRILIVDDSINVRNYLALILEKAGYQVEEAKDGQEAVDKLFKGLSVRAIISDIEMPRLDGYGLLETIKEKSEFKHLPIIMLTSRSNEKHRKLAFNLGARGYFSKPYNEQDLLKAIKDMITN